MVSVAYHLSKRGNTEIICFIFVNPQNNMISVMPILIPFQKIITTKENIFCSCRCPYDSEMVRCTVCEQWFHLRCLEQSLAEIYLSLTPVKTVQVKICFLSVMSSWWYSVRIPPFDVHASK